MTGFASKMLVLSLQDGTKVNVSINLKSLNSRFFEATCKLPYTLGQFETDFIKMIKKKLHRGHVYLTVHMSNQSAFKGSIEPSLVMLEGYMNALNKIKDTFNLEGTLSVSDVLQLPNIFSVEEKGVEQNAKEMIFSAIEQLCVDLTEARTREGANLKEDLVKRISIMHNEIDNIEKASHVLMETKKATITNALKEVEAESNELAELRKSALYHILDKIDIHEEIVRFKSHIKSLGNQLDTATIDKGKRLDFTLQEMAREINTIAAKCSDANISSLAINVKVELEKAREQVQNIV